MRFYSYIGLVVFLSFTYSSNAQLGFGDNLWNVNCYNSIAGDLHTLPSEYRGYYTQKLDVAGNIGFDSNLSWNADNGLPSNSTVFNNSQGVGSAYTGSIIDASGRNFSYVHKRKGFPSGKYRLTLKEWDDKTYVFINGIHRPFTGENGWGSNRMLVNCFELNEHSTIEVVTRNDGGGKTQAVLDIVKTDVLISEAIGVQQICKGSEIVLNGKVILGVANVNHDLYGLNFEVGSGTYTSSVATDWNENASVGTTGSGSAYISGTAPTPVNGDKWVKFGPFSTVGFSNLQLSYRHYYDHGSGKRARVEISNDNSNWSELVTYSSNQGNNTVFSPVLINTNTLENFTGQTGVYIRFYYVKTNNNSTTGSWSFDDVLVTGDGPANISYLWSPSTGLSDATAANPTVTITDSETYTVAVTVGNCTVTNDVAINMVEIPTQPTGASVQSISGNGPNVYSVDHVSGVTYTWTTDPGTNVGVFPNGNIGNPIEFMPTGEGDLVVTPSNMCGLGTSFVFGNPLPVTLTDFSINCGQELTINWSTASEQYSDYFVVEKSRDIEKWITVATQAAAGNSNTQINYTWMDANPWNGLTYYRLRQIDFNGSEKKYGPISSSCGNNENNMIIYPNPSNEGFTVEIFSNKIKMGAEIQFIDLTGKIIVFHDYKLQVGTNQLYFNTSDLMSGLYFVRLVGENTSFPPMRLVIE